MSCPELVESAKNDAEAAKTAAEAAQAQAEAAKADAEAAKAEAKGRPGLLQSRRRRGRQGPDRCGKPPG